VTATIWEWRATLDSGVNLRTGEAWRGHRIRYRALGARQYRSFLFTKDDGTNPTDTEVIHAINEHARRNP
jgi:hypothetical protein